MRLILLAHGLIDRSGHHYMEARAFREEAIKHGLDCTILAHRNIILSIREELVALPLFQHTPYKQFFRGRLLGSFRDFRRYSQLLSEDLLSLPQYTVTASDIVVSPLTKARDMLGLARWLSRTPGKQHPFVAINFMLDDITRPSKSNRAWTIDLNSARLYRFAFSRLRKSLNPDRLLLSAGGARFAQIMTRVLQHPVQNYPLPVQHDLIDPLSEDRLTKIPPQIAFLGHMHPRKGANLAGLVIGKILGQHPTCQAYLQANPTEWETRWVEEIGAAKMSRVHIHRGELSQDAYQNALKNADLVLLPYLPSAYALQTSGIFSEAMALGKISLVPEGTWMADMARNYGGGAEIYRGHDVDSIAGAGLRALDRLPELTGKMRTTSAKWRENMGMKAFLQRILLASGQ